MSESRWGSGRMARWTNLLCEIGFVQRAPRLGGFRFGRRGPRKTPNGAPPQRIGDSGGEDEPSTMREHYVTFGAPLDRPITGGV